MDWSRRKAMKILGALALSPGSGLAQPKGQLRRVGFLSGSKAPAKPGTGLSDLLKAHGYEVGRNLVIERRYAEEDFTRLPALARELVDAQVEVIICVSNPSTAAAASVTRAIPIVVMYGVAPMEAGFIDSLSRPGRNITGNAGYIPETGAKVFDVLLQAFPKARRAAMLWNPDRPGYHAYQSGLSAASVERGVKLESVDIRRTAELGSCLAKIETLRPELLVVVNDTIIFRELKEIANWARARKLPTMGTIETWVAVGGLLFYGPDEEELVRKLGHYVARILGGAKPQDLPMELPTRYLLHVNLDTARALDYSAPNALLLRADKVIGA